jgi:hypothetical protein
MIAIIIKALVSASADNSNLVLDNYRYHSQPYPIIVNRMLLWLLLQIQQPSLIITCGKDPVIKPALSAHMEDWVCHFFNKRFH